MRVQVRVCHCKSATKLTRCIGYVLACARTLCELATNPEVCFYNTLELLLHLDQVHLQTPPLHGRHLQLSEVVFMFATVVRKEWSRVVVQCRRVSGTGGRSARESQIAGRAHRTLFPPALTKTPINTSIPATHDDGRPRPKLAINATLLDRQCTQTKFRTDSSTTELAHGLMHLQTAA